MRFEVFDYAQTDKNLLIILPHSAGFQTCAYSFIIIVKIFRSSKNNPILLILLFLHGKRAVNFINGRKNIRNILFVAVIHLFIL